MSNENEELVRRIEDVLSEQPIVGRPMLPFTEEEWRTIAAALSRSGPSEEEVRCAGRVVSAWIGGFGEDLDVVKLARAVLRMAGKP